MQRALVNWQCRPIEFAFSMPVVFVFDAALLCFYLFDLLLFLLPKPASIAL
jgi:hypothetical protein